MRKYLPRATDQDDLQYARSWMESLLSRHHLIYHRVGSSARGTATRNNRELDYYIDATEAQFAPLVRQLDLERRYRTGGISYYHLVTTLRTMIFHFDLIPIPQARHTAERALLHQEYMMARLDARLRRQIIYTKALLKKVGLYDAHEQIRGFSGWAVQVLILRYGSVYHVPQGTRWISCPVQPTRNVLASVSPRNLWRFYALRRTQFYRKSSVEYPGNLYLYRGPENLEKDPHVLCIVRRGGVTLIQVRDVLRGPVSPQHHHLPDRYFREQEGVRLYCTRQGYLKVTSSHGFCQRYMLEPVSPTDYTNIRIFNYFH